MRDTTDEHIRLTAARAGDHDAFERLVEPYRRELVVHCYRMFGSLEDAEDILQETLLRAWRKLDTFEGRASLRAWLYKIATNAALDALDKHRRRNMPPAAYAPASPSAPLPAPLQEALWLEPLPDELVDHRTSTNPEARYEVHETVTLAFLSMLQHLPGRQRAALVLRDVLGFSTHESAEMLDMTIAAVNSALQRARATVQSLSHKRNERPVAQDEQTARLLTRYVQAWESADTSLLVSLLREDAVLTMPPYAAWFRGHADIAAFLTHHIFGASGPACFRLRPTRANGGPAFAVYTNADTGSYTPSALQLLTISGGLVSHIDDFLVTDLSAPRLFTRFHLPLTL